MSNRRWGSGRLAEACGISPGGSGELWKVLEEERDPIVVLGMLRWTRQERLEPPSRP